MDAPKWKEWVIRNESPHVSGGRPASWFFNLEEKKKSDGEKLDRLRERDRERERERYC